MFQLCQIRSVAIASSRWAAGSTRWANAGKGPGDGVTAPFLQAELPFQRRFTD